MVYKVQIAHGDCHPETCACSQYEVVDEFGRLKFGPHSCCVAKKLCDVLNGKNMINEYGQFHGCPVDHVPLSVHDSIAQDLLYCYALRKLGGSENKFAEDLISALETAGYDLESYR